MFMSCVTYHMSHVTCPVSHVMCHVSQKKFKQNLGKSYKRKKIYSPAPHSVSGRTQQAYQRITILQQELNLQQNSKCSKQQQKSRIRQTLNLSTCADSSIDSKTVLNALKRPNKNHMSPVHVMCHISHVTCHLSCITCHMSRVTKEI